MGKFKSCVISLKGRKEVYRDGELLSGVVILDVLEPVKVKAIRVYCYGLALTKWSKDFSRDLDTDLVGQEQYFSQVVTVFGRKKNVDGPNETLTAEKHRWTFAFRLPPDRLPSSVEGEYGAVRWFLKVEADRPFPIFNDTWYHPFTVLAYLDCNQPVFKTSSALTATKTVSKTLGLGNAGTLTLTAQTDRFGYCPGEFIIINAKAVNESLKDMGPVRAALTSRMVFKANTETKDSTWTLSTLQTNAPLAKGTTMDMTDLRLLVPLVPPSTRKRTCQIISCVYSVKVFIHVPWGFDLEVKLPIAICTVPLGKKVAPPRQTAGQAADPSTVIVYEKCRAGLKPCTKSYQTFARLPYTPYTAFVAPGSTPALPPPAPAQPHPHPKPASAPAAKVPPGPAQPSAQSPQRSQPPPSQPSSGPYPSPQGPAAPPTQVGGGGVCPTLQAGGAGARVPSAPPVYCEDDFAPRSLAPAVAPGEEGLLPPSYEDVLRMDEQAGRAGASQTSTAAALGAGDPVCQLMVLRFPDVHLAAFRAYCQRRHSVLVALSPQPQLQLEDRMEEWPERWSAAVLAFPDVDSGEAWLEGQGDREQGREGEDWHAACDAFIVPSLHPADKYTSGCSVLSLGWVKQKEKITKSDLAIIKKAVPLFTKLREDHHGVKEVATKKSQMLRGQWLDDGQMVVLTSWPKLMDLANYTIHAYTDLASQTKTFKACFDTKTIVLVSEDVTPLSNQPPVSGDDDDDADDDDENYDPEAAENVEDEQEGAGGGLGDDEKYKDTSEKRPLP